MSLRDYPDGKHNQVGGAGSPLPAARWSEAADEPFGLEATAARGDARPTH